ncbi:MAG: FliA/WhiG family RNA polymerase sigma factor [Candidatus Eremiobacteraeota bacterium]|nr:FliA/WhiG family RNA polymerase sigma factor [Candidatus Eremiobacteraeota bacterium]MCW5870812.1 FliA/WhiG family RNA polymerase sigma factor [Candidatus Eremiobacteraeota bacterium]
MQTTIQNKLSSGDKQELANHYAGLVKHIALRMAVKLPNHIEVDDLIHDGVVGLMDALHRFDPSKHIKFSTYASTRIRGAMLDALRALDWASRGARRRGRELQLAEEQLAQSLGRQPSLQELAASTGLSPSQLRRRRVELASTQLVSLDDSRSTNGEFEDTLSDSVADESACVESHCFQAEKKQMLLRALKTLRERDQLILNLYYFEELNIREIGAALGVSEARISQLHTRGIRRLKEFLEQAA